MDEDDERFRMAAEELKVYSAEIAKMQETCAASGRTTGHQDVASKSRKKAATVRSKVQFIMFPVEWQFRLARVDADKCTYRIALHLLHEAWRSQNAHLKLANVGLKGLGVGREGKRHALDQLEEAGLVSVERMNRKSPVVKVKFINWGNVG
jgi:hypothetical protein